MRKHDSYSSTFLISLINYEPEGNNRIFRLTFDQQAVALDENIYLFAGFTCDKVTIDDPCTSSKYRWETYKIDQKLRLGRYFVGAVANFSG